jgi:mRNA (guanine-N7-)-methyltransferase
MESLLNQYEKMKSPDVEFEARIGPTASKVDYNNVIQWLLVSGFVIANPAGDDLLRIGFQKQDENVRIEINKIGNIQRYCRTQELVQPLFQKKKRIQKYDIEQYWTNLSLSTETPLTEEEQAGAIKTKPSSYRFMNRIRLTSPDHSFVYDCSIVRTSSSLDTLFTVDPTYEIEAEFNEKKDIRKQIQQAITFALRGFQRSYYPVSNAVMQQVREDYKRIVSVDTFIGPRSVTMQEDNLHGDSSIYKTHCLTEKADGERKMLFISNDKIYFLLAGSTLQVEWTGGEVKGYNGTLMDGEHVTSQKDGTQMNLYLAFDIYFHKLKKETKDVRTEPFLSLIGEDNRYDRLKNAIEKINDHRNKTFVLSYKTFEVCTYESCKQLLRKTKLPYDQGGFIYHIDGLIFTPMHYGVGMSSDDKTVKNYEYVWELNLKWKPASENTIDFLVQFEQKDHYKSTSTDSYAYKMMQLFVQFNQRDVYANPSDSIFQGYETKAPEKSKNVLFKPSEPLNAIGESVDNQSHLCCLKSEDGTIYTEHREIIETNMIVECRYDMSREEGWRWIPLRVRWDKMKRRNPNAFTTASSNWYTIHIPITEEMLSRPYESMQYYAENKERSALRKFHNIVKTELLDNVIKKGDLVIDFAVGRGGDLMKWNKAKFVLGVDIDENNIVNKKWGACRRYLDLWKGGKYKTRALFVQGDSSKRIKNGDAIRGLREKAIVRSVFGMDQKRGLGKGVDDHYNSAKSGFQVTSIQFAVHYMFGNVTSLSHFLQNVAECTALNGHFVGTCYDGSSVFEKLKTSVVYTIGTKSAPICTISKKYKETEVDMTSDSCLGYKIGVRQTSIGSEHDEYLVFFPYFESMMRGYGFEKVAITGFEKIYEHSLKDMNEYEKELSFLNCTFVFQKVRELTILPTKEYMTII